MSVSSPLEFETTQIRIREWKTKPPPPCPELDQLVPWMQAVEFLHPRKDRAPALWDRAQGTPAEQKEMCSLPASGRVWRGDQAGDREPLEARKGDAVGTRDGRTYVVTWQGSRC